MQEALDIFTIVLAGLMVGNELAIAVFIHPILDRLPEKAHLPTAIAIARFLGRVMPFWYGLVLVLLGLAAFLHHRVSGEWSWPLIISSALWAVSIGFTIAALVPINNRVASWTEASRPNNWRTDRHRWDVLHRWRVLLLTIAFALLVFGLHICGA
jgi:uncharacterized membrane protein